MTSPGPVFLRHIRSLFLLSSFLFALSFCLYSPCAAGQNDDVYEVYGYVTAVDSPSSFDVNGTPVTTSPETRFGLMGDKNPSSSSPLRASIRVGQFVHVVWPPDSSPKSSAAATVFVRDDGEKKLSGFGLIDKVIATGSVPIFQADGYRIRIEPGTATTYSGSLKSLVDVGPNTWVEYEGRRDKTGDLVATKAQFIPSKSNKKTLAQIAKDSAIKDAIPADAKLIDGIGRFIPGHTKYRLSDVGGSWCGPRLLATDQALQQRVWQVGMSVVPAFQKQMARDQAVRIHFRFYAVDDPKMRSDYTCEQGLVLVPEQMVKRLKGDDQLAAVLADGVAFSLQMQSAKLNQEYNLLTSAELASDAAAGFFPWVYWGAEVGTDIAGYKIYKQMEEQRGRMVLALMADAGYDPWAAPEALAAAGSEEAAQESGHTRLSEPQQVSARHSESAVQTERGRCGSQVSQMQECVYGSPTRFEKSSGRGGRARRPELVRARGGHGSRRGLRRRLLALRVL